MAHVSVIIPTKDRPALLRRCLDAVLSQETERGFDVIVVNDSIEPVDAAIERIKGVRVVCGRRAGPAAARNAGIDAVSSGIVLFTDDDAIPQPGWIGAAMTALSACPEAVGVVGRVTSPAFDPLYERSVDADGLGNFVTCNVAYRFEALRKTGGFDVHFRYPHGEDKDLGLRMQEIGTVLYEPNMDVIHPPRRHGVRGVVRRARFIESDWRLYERHPQTRPPRWSARWAPLIRLARHWQRLATEDRIIRGSPCRAVRLIALATAQLAVAFVLSVRGPKGGMEGAVELCGDNARLRIAWIGAEPKCGGGVAGCAWLIMKGLTERGCMVDWYASGPYEELADRVAGLRSVRLISYDTGWRFSRWYSKHRVTKVFSGFSNRARARRRLGSLLLQQHRHRPYDVIYQFSTIEIFGIRRQVQRLPPLVVHPETHIAGELRWVRRERPLAARCEPLWRRMAIELFLMGRARRQRHDIRLAARVAAISDVFGRYLVDDYGLDPSRLFRIPNPIDTDELRVHHNRSGHPPWRIAFVGRMSVRKGVDLIIELSHRLADLEGDVSLELVGADTLWSDYRPLLVDLNENIAIYHGQMSRHQLIEFLQGVDLLVQPAKYEPFGLTVGEALALGVPVVASTEVGAVEGISPECCAVFESGNANELERVVRAQLHRLRNGDGPSMSVSARVEAERRFAPEKIADLALSMLSTLAPQGAAS